jgi:hypothetical protein
MFGHRPYLYTATRQQAPPTPLARYRFAHVRPNPTLAREYFLEEPGTQLTVFEAVWLFLAWALPWVCRLAAGGMLLGGLWFDDPLVVAILGTVGVVMVFGMVTLAVMAPQPDPHHPAGPC